MIWFNLPAITLDSPWLDLPCMRLRLEVEPRDAWVGAYIDQRREGLHLFLCGVPFVPLHVIVRNRA
jgi:hypothetical protein